MNKTVSLGSATATIAANTRGDFAGISLTSGGITVTLTLTAGECNRLAEALANAALALPRGSLS